jgi:hypothetical protein
MVWETSFSAMMNNTYVASSVLNISSGEREKERGGDRFSNRNSFHTHAFCTFDSRKFASMIR